MSGQNLSLSSGLTSNETTYQSLIKQLVTQLDDPQKSQMLSDVRHNTSLIKSFTSTVGSFFGSSSKLAHKKPLIGDAQVVVLFVVGGITGAEMVDIQEVVQKTSGGALAGKVILIGGTRLSTPEFVYDHVMCRSN